MFDQFISSRAAIAAEQRKVLSSLYGDRVLAIITVNDQLNGYKGVPILRSAIPGKEKVGELFENGHHVDDHLGFHLGGVRIDQLIENGCTFEEALFTLWVGYPPCSQEEVEVVADLLKESRRSFVQSSAWSETLLYLDTLCSLRAGNVDMMHVLVGILSFLARYSKVGALIDSDCTEAITLRDRFDEWLFIQTAMGLLIPAAYRKLYRNADPIVPDASRGYSSAFAEALGVAESEERLSKLASIFDMLFILMVHHGPGNGSTFSGLVANSFGTTAFDSMISMMGALLGPNHGKASTLGLRFLFSIKEELGEGCTKEELIAFARERLLESPKKPAWCIGHALLKMPKGIDPEAFLGDPRTAVLVHWLEANYAQHPFYILARSWYDAVTPIVAKEIGAAFPKPNVDAYSGLVLALEGIIASPSEASFIGAIFGVSRIAGACAEAFYQVAATGGKPRPFRPGDIRDESIPDLPRKGE